MNDVIILKDASVRFTEFLKNQKRASATILAYSNDIAQMTKFFDKKSISAITAVNSELLDEFKANLTQNGYTPKSVSRKINSIKTFF